MIATSETSQLKFWGKKKKPTGEECEGSSID
jgi:hypothetical protein